MQQTLGIGFVLEESEKIFEFKTLELPWVDNKKNVSCIPPGYYNLYKRHSKKNGKVFEFKNVKKRNHIQIHSGNYHTEIQGCILVGKKFQDINEDGHLDVISSRNTLDELYRLLPGNFSANIVEDF